MNATLSSTARWLWHSPSPAALASRLLLAPAALAYRAGTTIRNLAYDAGLLKRHALPLPAIGVGNLSVGGTGKTPLTIHLARELLRRGVRPAILLRGYGGDELIEHRAAVPGAIVEAGADRAAGARRAAAQGAQVLVLDDCLQRRDVVVDLMLATVSAETWTGLRFPLPAGPWREGTRALRRVDHVVVTRKLADQAAAAALGSDLARHTRQPAFVVACFGLTALEPLLGGPTETLEAIKGRVVSAVCGVGEPDLFAGQLERAGAWVDLVAFPDHHAFTIPVVARLAQEARLQGRWVVTTVKDAVKLMDLWPPEGAPCYVARLGVNITAGEPELSRALDAVADQARRTTPTSEQ